MSHAHPGPAGLGDPNTWGGDLATIAPASDFKGDPARACWLPDAYVAAVWQAFVVREPKLSIAAPDGPAPGVRALIAVATDPPPGASSSPARTPSLSSPPPTPHPPPGRSDDGCLYGDPKPMRTKRRSS